MRNKTIIFFLLSAVMFAVASREVSSSRTTPRRMVNDSIEVAVDSLIRNIKPTTAPPSITLDTIGMDSLARAIYMHNKSVDDSIRADSLQRMKSNGIESPVTYSANDSLVYDAESGMAYLYGSSKVDYQAMKLTSDKVSIDMAKNTVTAIGTPDSTADDGQKGRPLFSMGKDEYKSDTMAFNFKSKKGLISGVYTKQEDGFLTGERAKRDSSGVIYIQRGRYTTCDAPHPDFYIALSRAKVRPNKDVVFGPAYLVVADVPLPLAIPYGSIFAMAATISL